MADLAHCFHRLLADPEPEPDGDLLGRFVTDRDENAFATLVRRHGPMVLAVCQRVLRHRQDAEDAFQATFLVLARRADVVRPRSALGNWLYGVAYRTALGARRVAVARTAREAAAGAMRCTEATPDEHDQLPDLREALDRELAALPDTYRAAVVACDLEGLSRRAAAARLGWAEGTLSGRLARARSLLARRLKKAGRVLPTAGLVVLDGPTVLASRLADTTVRLGTLVAAGDAAVAAPVAALMEGTMKAMLMTKLKGLTAALVVGCAGLVTIGAGWRANEVGAADPPATRAKATDAPRKEVRDADKDRIAELERERDRLLKEVIDLRVRLALVEADHKSALDQARQMRLLADLTEAKLKAASADQTRVAPASPEADPRRRPAVVSVSPAQGPDVPRTLSRPLPSAPPLVSNMPGLSAPTLSPQPNPDAAPPATPVVRVYPVGDMAADEKEGEALAKVLRATVEPKSWGIDAGVEYLPGQKSLVVRQSAQGHNEVEKLLSLLKGEADKAQIRGREAVEQRNRLLKGELERNPPKPGTGPPVP